MAASSIRGLPQHTLTALRTDLRRLGVRPGDMLIVHSSMKRIGPVRGGPKTVIASLQQAVGPRGTILMPAFSYSFEKVYHSIDPYDPRTTPSRVGLVSETFRQSAGVLRSGHPTHSVAAWGRLAQELTEGHQSNAGLAAESPMARAAAQGAKVLLLGCGFPALSVLHVAEEMAQVPYLSIFSWWQEGWLPSVRTQDERGQPVSVVLPHVPGCSRTFGKAEALAADKALLHDGRYGSAAVLIFEAAPLLDLVADRLRREPDFLLCVAGSCRTCDERRVVFEPSEPGATEIGRFMVNVVGQCGCRVAGSPGEDQAADLISSEMTRIGLQDVKTLHFPIHAWEPGHSTLEVCVGGQWETAASMPVAHSPSTEGRILQGRAVHIESMADLGKLRSPAGTVAVLWDGYGESLAEFRRLMDCRFAAIILVDKRFAHGDVVAEGVAALWIPHFKTPMITVPHPQMVRLFGHGPVDCRLSVGGCVRPGRSSVVSGEIPGRRPDAILLCGHHDTTANSAAPDDNLSGVATVLRVAAILTERGLRPWHTIRFCSFGAEEQLSEGARWYALESGHGAEVRFVLNTDSAGARCGTTGVHVTGGDDLVAWIRDEAGRSDLQLKIIPEVCPFSDQFPLNCCGVPSVWFYRQTMTAGRHFHHTIRDTLSEISFDQLARLAEYQAQLVQRLAGRTTWPFHPRLPAKAARAVAVAGQNWFGSAVGQSQHQKNKDS